MRRTDRELTHDDALAILAAGQYGVLSTISPDGKPYGVPISYCVIDGEVYFHSATTGAKLDNIEHSPTVSFCVVGATEVLPAEFGTRYESCVIAGRAAEVTGEVKQRALEGLVAKYSRGFEAEGLRYIRSAIDVVRVFRIMPLYITGKARRT